MYFQLTNSRSESLRMWQCSRIGSAAESPQTIQQGSPRNVSRRSILVSNAEVADERDISHSSRPYPVGGPFVESGSGSGEI